MSVRSLEPLLGDVSRREMLGTLARWSVPTVLTMSLLSPQALAAASCPPCTKKTGGRCKACTMNQILNCQCEPCLGAPYCAGGAAVMAAPSQSSSQSQLEGTGSSPLLAPEQSLEDPYSQLLRSPGTQGSQNPFTFGRPSPFQAPLGSSQPLGLPGGGSRSSRGGLFDRLRPDARRPF